MKYQTSTKYQDIYNKLDSSYSSESFGYWGRMASGEKALNEAAKYGEVIKADDTEALIALNCTQASKIINTRRQYDENDTPRNEEIKVWVDADGDELETVEGPDGDYYLVTVNTPRDAGLVTEQAPVSAEIAAEAPTEVETKEIKVNGTGDRVKMEIVGDHLTFSFKTPSRTLVDGQFKQVHDSWAFFGTYSVEGWSLGRRFQNKDGAIICSALIAVFGNEMKDWQFKALNLQSLVDGGMNPAQVDLLNFSIDARHSSLSNQAPGKRRGPRKDAMTTAQVATRLGVTRIAVLKAIKRGTLPAKKQGRDWIVNERAVEAYRQNHLGRKGRPAKTE